MARYLDVLEQLLEEIASGGLAPASTVPSVRELARREGIAPTTAARVLAELARGGVISGAARRRSVVAPDGRRRARRVLAGGRTLRLAGSDDPLLDRLLAEHLDVERAPGRGSFAGLRDLWAGTADAATVHLLHRDGNYNDAVRALGARRTRPPRRPALAARARTAGAGGKPARHRRRRVACPAHRRPPRARTGTRVLLERLMLDSHADPAALHGAVHASHLEVAMAVASGTAEVGVATRAAAAAFALDFVPLGWSRSSWRSPARPASSPRT